MHSLRVGVDGYNLALPRGTGVASYGLNLTRALEASGHRVDGVFGLPVGRNPVLKEVVFFDRLGRGTPSPRRGFRAKFADWKALASGIHLDEVIKTGSVDCEAFADRLPAFEHLYSAPFLFERAHRWFRLTGRFLAVRAPAGMDVMHWTYPVPIVLTGVPNIYTIHDIVPLRLPHTTLDDKQYVHRLIRTAIDHAALICTVSEKSRSDILLTFKIGVDHVVNTYQDAPVPVDTISPDPMTDALIVASTFGLQHQGYFLFYGAIEPKKNVGRLIEGYLALDSETPLVIVGGKGWQSDDELRLLPDGPRLNTPFGRAMGHRIVRLSHLDRATLLRLIRSARAVVFPSLYEGFGLPVLEAMQFGTPVLTSTGGALPEVAGDAAILVDPYDVGSICAGLRQLDEDIAFRGELARRGLAQATKFSTECYMKRLEEMYRMVLAAHRTSQRKDNVG